MIGILTRKIDIEAKLINKYLGDALYAVMLYLGFAFIWPSQKIVVRLTLAAMAVATIECFQLTGIPLQLRNSGNSLAKFVSIVLGTHFSWLDMVAYVVGLAAIVTLDYRFARGPTLES